MNNDLISREALRNVILNDRKLDGVNANWEVNRILVHIENAPTVEPHYISDLPDDVVKTLQTLAIDYSDGIAIFERKRPQGEWARHDEWVNGEYVGEFYHINCPVIEEGHALYSRWETRFCPNCGACMQKGGTE